MNTQSSRTDILKAFFNSIKTGDPWSRLASSAVVLPQAMAFGVTLMAPDGLAASRGVLAGLIGAGIAWN